MKNNNLKYLILLFVITFFSCEKSDIINENEIIIVGKWKLLKIYESDEPSNLIGCEICYYYDFKSYNTLKTRFSRCGPACDCFRV